MLFKDNQEAQAFWGRITKGDMDAETLEKLKDVAYEISHAAFYDEYDNAARRAEATLKAVGRYGRSEKVPGLKNLALNIMPGEEAPYLASVGDLLGHIPPPESAEDIKNREKAIREIRRRAGKG